MRPRNSSLPSIDQQGEISRPVEAARAKRVVDETLVGELGACEVAARHLDATDVELAGNADRHRAEPLVAHVHLRVGNRLPDRHDTRGVVGIALPVGDVDGGLGWPIEVVQLDVVEDREEALLQVVRERLA